MKTVTLVLIISTFSIWDGSVKKVEEKRIEYLNMESCKEAANKFNTDSRYRDNIVATCAEEMK